MTQEERKSYAVGLSLEQLTRTLWERACTMGALLFWLLVFNSRASKHKLQVTRLGQVVQNRSQKMKVNK
jgi:hypothetical protein